MGFNSTTQDPNTPVLTGIGTIAATGLGTDQFWACLLAGASKVGQITRFDASTFPCNLAGEVADNLIANLLPPRKLRTTSHASRLALISTDQALADARFDSPQGDNIGVVVATALGGWIDAEKQFATIREKGAGRVNPLLVSGSGCHAAAAEIAQSKKMLGPQHTVSTSCAASLQALSLASNLIREREVEVCLVSGSESPLSPTLLAAMGKSDELAQGRSADKASRPFDRGHSGIIPSEGACTVVVESAEHARNRGAKAYAEIAGAASSSDSLGMFGIDESGESGARAIHRMISRSRITPDQIDYVCAHANSSPAFDRKEAIVLRKAFGEFAAKIPVSSIKGVLGHPFGASGAFQTAAAALAMKHSLIPHTANLENPDPECDLDLVMGEPRPAEIRHALITSYGYGGVNAYLLLRNPNL